MGSTRKAFSLLLVVILAVSSLIMVESAFAQSIPKPSVPEFTMKYIDNSYDVPPTYEKDQYTGQQVITHNGYHVDDRSLVFTIKSQPFTTYNDSVGNVINLYYNFRFKGVFGDQWNYYPFEEGHSTRTFGGLGNMGDYFPNFSASKSGETILPIALKSFSAGIPNGYPVEFQVQAQIGYITGQGVSMAMGSSYEFTGQSSDWSSTQTITIGETSATSSPNPTQSPTNTPSPTPTPSIPEFSWLAILPLMIAILSAAVILRHRKTANLNK